MQKLKKISIVLVICSLFVIGLLNNTQVTEITSHLIKMKESNAKEYINLSSDKVALMNYYMPNSRKTLFSGLSIESIELESEKDGTIYIGTAKIEDVVKSRQDGTALSDKTKAYSVTKGKNTITLNIKVGENETIVIGGTNSVSIAHIKEATTSKEDNVFALIDAQKHNDVLNTTNNKNDKLAITVNINTKVYSEVVENYISSAPAVSEMSKIQVNHAASPWAHFNNNELYSNKTITRIDLPVRSVAAIDDQQFVDFHVIDSTELKVGNVVTKKETHHVYIPYDQIEGLNKDAIDKWISITGLNIELKENETLAIGGSTTGGTIQIGYASSKGKSWQDIGKQNLSEQNYEIYYVGYTSTEISIQEHIDKITKEERVLAKLKDKKVSILGDSISTFGGVSNNATDSNSTIGDNSVWYSDTHYQVSDVNETWWMQTINELGMKLLVNNSSSGSVVFGTNAKSGYKTRVLNLHDNTNPEDSTDTNYVVDPDIIFIYMGINDAKINQNDLAKQGKYENINFDSLITKNTDGTFSYKEPTTFAEAYAIMLHKAINRYTESEIYVFTLQQASYSEFGQESISYTNDIIRKLANHYKLEIIDLYENYPKNSVLHPNASGMATMSQIVQEKLLADALKSVEKDIEDEKNNQQNNNQDSNIENENDQNNQDEVENPYTSTSALKIITMVVLIVTLAIIYKSTKYTKVKRY